MLKVLVFALVIALSFTPKMLIMPEELEKTVLTDAPNKKKKLE